MKFPGQTRTFLIQIKLMYRIQIFSMCYILFTQSKRKLKVLKFFKENKRFSQNVYFILFEFKFKLKKI